ncbi:hypothetical protein PsorP6_000837 [Peronosclerospora sorghi]|uniref:Uncharacterized protein n=1 Tax=Peronosclerospora sorghi TaxID=230839 RepID=A0ACC0WQ06_9STRA|nr:hypothetical protein PsorP6_000837 [Peronosclerospora sorghi]
MKRGMLMRSRVALVNCRHPSDGLRTLLSSLIPNEAADALDYSSSWRMFRPLASNVRHASSAPAPRRSRASRRNVIGDLEALVHETKRLGHKPQLSDDYLRRAGSVLQACTTREHYTAAIPLCKLLQRSSSTNGRAEMKCIRVYQKAGRNHEVIALVEKLMKQDVVLLNQALASALQACAALGQVEKAFHFFDAAVQRGASPNLNVYSALLAAAGVGTDPERVQTVMNQMEQAGFQMNNITFHSLMNVYARQGNVTKTLELFDLMQRKGIPAEEHTYAIIMNAHIWNEDLEGAKAVMEELKKASLQPNRVHYNIMLKGCGKVSDLSLAFQLYAEMKQRKIQPDLVTFITMMHAVYHAELWSIDEKKVKAALMGMGLMGAAFVPWIDYQAYMLPTLFCSTLVGSMGVAAYTNPDAVIRTLYPNTDEPRTDTIIKAFCRRLCEEVHCSRSMRLWQEMQAFKVAPDSRVYDILVRTCVRKRHPDLAYEALFQEKLPLVDKEGKFVLTFSTTLGLLQSLLAQQCFHMADTLYDAARNYGVFATVFSEKKHSYVYDMRSFFNEQVRSYVLIKLINELRAKVEASEGARGAPNVQFLVQHGYELLDRLDMDHPSLRRLFSMDDMARIGAASDATTSAQYYFRLAIPAERLQLYFESTRADAGNERRL